MQLQVCVKKVIRANETVAKVNFFIPRVFKLQKIKTHLQHYCYYA